MPKKHSQGGHGVGITGTPANVVLTIPLPDPSLPATEIAVSNLTPENLRLYDDNPRSSCQVYPGCMLISVNNVSTPPGPTVNTPVGNLMIGRQPEEYEVGASMKYGEIVVEFPTEHVYADGSVHPMNPPGYEADLVGADGATSPRWWFILRRP